MMIKDLKELIVTLDQSSVQHFEMENAEIKLKISKNQGVALASVEHAIPAASGVQSLVKPIQELVEEPKAMDDPSIEVVLSPMVGVFYGAPSPDADAFVTVGGQVQKGQTLCIIEAMKIMNEIESEFSGTVVELLVDNEDVVEYGQPIMRIRRG